MFPQYSDIIERGRERGREREEAREGEREREREFAYIVCHMANYFSCEKHIVLDKIKMLL